VEQQGLIHTRK